MPLIKLATASPYLIHVRESCILSLIGAPQSTNAVQRRRERCRQASTVVNSVTLCVSTCSSRLIAMMDDGRAEDMQIRFRSTPTTSVGDADSDDDCGGAVVAVL